MMASLQQSNKHCLLQSCTLLDFLRQRHTVQLFRTCDLKKQIWTLDTAKGVIANKALSQGPFFSCRRMTTDQGPKLHEACRDSITFGRCVVRSRHTLRIPPRRVAGKTRLTNKFQSESLTRVGTGKLFRMETFRSSTHANRAPEEADSPHQAALWLRIMLLSAWLTKMRRILPASSLAPTPGTKA